ncbi:MAG: glycosyltransferase, partial [Planctomycetota bacterium]|nr:glycosyltransferase [Planctomycetota bacterium]
MIALKISSGENVDLFTRDLLAEKDMKVALIHYWLVSWRGGEKVVESISKMFSDLDIYTLFLDPQIKEEYFPDREVYSSNLDTPFFRKRYQKSFPLYPRAIRSLQLQREYDLIISSESGPAKGISNPQKTPHLCYVHTPMRYCWGKTEEYLNVLPKVIRPFARHAFEKLRKWDETTISNVDRYVVNSKNVQKRVEKYYGRDSHVVYPPIALDLFENPLVNRPPQERESYLSFGALTPYKRIDLLVDAFNQNGKKLLVVGEGSERKKLMVKAGDNIRFTGSLPFSEIIRRIQESKALLFPGEEDFGMIPLEVMAMGLPVIAYRAGGALETVVEREECPAESTGLFFDHQTVESLNERLEEFERRASEFSSSWI